jgi:hypothetical protein
MTNVVSVAKKRLIESGLATAESIQGCEQADIDYIESGGSVLLP